MQSTTGGRTLGPVARPRRSAGPELDLQWICIKMSRFPASDDAAKRDMEYFQEYFAPEN
jgi:hypothetical protein